MNLAKKIKLFICITKSDWGGAQKYVFDLAKNASTDIFDTTVLVGSKTCSSEIDDLKKRLDDINIKNILLKNSKRDINYKKELFLFIELFKLFNKEKPNVVHLNSSKIGFTGSWVIFILNIYFKLSLKKTRIRSIFTIHGWAFNEKRNFLSRFFIKIFYFFIILLSDKTIAVSENTKKQIGKIFNKKIIVIRNGIDEISFKTKEESRKFIYEKIINLNPKATSILAKKPLWIGTISELHTSKGINYTIDAISKIRNVIFVIIGEGEKRKELEEQIIKLGLSNKVFLLGYIKNASSYLKSFDIFTLTSITEALPYVLLESGKANLPVIASEVGGIPEIIDNNKNGLLISPKNSEEIRNSIEYFIKNPLYMKDFGIELNKKIIETFSEKEMLEKTFWLYKKML